MTDAELTEKLIRFEAVSDDAEWHSLALEFADNSDRRIFDVLVKLIQRPDLAGKYGTLIYCLGAHDCSSITDLLGHIEATGNFVAGFQAKSILDNQGLR